MLPLGTRGLKTGAGVIVCFGAGRNGLLAKGGVIAVFFSTDRLSAAAS